MYISHFLSKGTIVDQQKIIVISQVITMMMQVAFDEILTDHNFVPELIVLVNLSLSLSCIYS